ncbi:chorismate--pyruvate lyase family protein [Marinimicrobium sp. ARAG 43.8]|uniref:chorismate--pyruvate lyase family protein n=1 Tax=Marinimicrobium sp. ARAG 43.8 TaxID=3418719 RepID=UPI003CFA1084
MTQSNPLFQAANPRRKTVNLDGCPAELKPWLLDRGSLTAKLKRHSGGQFRVQVLSQRLAAPTLNERRRLGMKSGHWALVREVVLLGHEQAWVFARSLVPLASLTGRLRQLRWLDSRPLGEFLFGQPDLEREPLEVARLSPSGGYAPAELQQDQVLWARRSVFRLNDRALLVGEVFLPDFLTPLKPSCN